MNNLENLIYGSILGKGIFLPNKILLIKHNNYNYLNYCKKSVSVPTVLSNNSLYLKLDNDIIDYNISEINKPILYHWFIQRSCNYQKRRQILLFIKGNSLDYVNKISNLIPYKNYVNKHSNLNTYKITLHSSEYEKFLSEVNIFDIESKFDKSKVITTNTKKASRKLNYQIANEIRIKYCTKLYTIKKLAEEYGVCNTTIIDIIQNKRYKTIKLKSNGVIKIKINSNNKVNYIYG